MKVKYQLRHVAKDQKIIFEHLLLNEIDKQRWNCVVYLKLWKSVGLICTQ